MKNFFIYPLSFKKYYDINKNDNKSKLELFDDFYKYGGLPFTILLGNNKTEIYKYISSIDSDIQVRDVSNYLKDEKNIFVDDNALSQIKKYMFQTIGNSISINNIRNSLRQNNFTIRNDLLSKIIHAFCSCYQLFKVDRYDIYGKNTLKTDYKFYVNDLSFRNVNISNINEGYGFALENIVYFELLRRGYKVYTGKNKNKEIDFVALKNEEILYIQVADKLNSNDYDREVNSLIYSKGCTKKILLYMSSEERMDDDSIFYKNIVNWLLEEKL